MIYDTTSSRFVNKLASNDKPIYDVLAQSAANPFGLLPEPTMPSAHDAARDGRRHHAQE